jgi:predicted phosphate transport protein (TIGR00153 family)
VRSVRARGNEGESFRRRLDDAVLVLFSVVAEAVGWATEALLDQDTDRARMVIDDDRAVDIRCEELTSLIKERLAGAPLALDELEDLIAILQIVPEIERSADLAEHIAQRALRSVGGVITPRSRGLIEKMGVVTTEMWRGASAAYRLRSKDASFQLNDSDDQLDQLASELINEVIESNASPQIAVDVGLIARFYERLGDHAVNLARRVEFMNAPRRLGGPRLRLTRSTATSETAPSRGRIRNVLRGLSRFRLTPSDEGFFELFRAAAENCRDCAGTLRKLVSSIREPEELFEEVKAHEQRGDQLTVEILSRLDRSFVTPFDREDIHALAEELDDVVDAMLTAASLIELAREEEPPPELAELTETLVTMADELVALVTSLPLGEGARLHLERIGHLERQGDAAFRHGMGKLLSGAYEALAVIAWKDIIQAVEESLNSIEDASDVIEGILVKNS